MEDRMEGDCVEVKTMSGKKFWTPELNKLRKNSLCSISKCKLADILWSCYKIFLQEEDYEDKN